MKTFEIALDAVARRGAEKAVRIGTVSSTGTATL